MKLFDDVQIVAHSFEQGRAILEIQGNGYLTTVFERRSKDFIPNFEIGEPVGLQPVPILEPAHLG